MLTTNIFPLFQWERTMYQTDEYFFANDVNIQVIEIFAIELLGKQKTT